MLMPLEHRYLAMTLRCRAIASLRLPLSRVNYSTADVHAEELTRAERSNPASRPCKSAHAFCRMCQLACSL